LPSYALELQVHRLHDRLPWSTENVRFALVPAVHWELEKPSGTGSAITAAGNLLTFGRLPGTEAPDRYALSTLVRIPTARRLRWIASTTGAVRLSVNGETKIDSREESDFMPAFHRATAGKFVDLDMEAGGYVLKLEAEKGEGPLQAAVVPVATGETETPGGHYFMTDIVFLPLR